jgi:hypothetical protein
MLARCLPGGGQDQPGYFIEKIGTNNITLIDQLGYHPI